MSTSDRATSTGLPRALTQVFGIAVAAAAIVVTVYLVHFYFYLHRPISSQPDAWGQFGDYFGGILNPTIALGALLLLAVGVRIQNETLREAKKQLDLQRSELEQTRTVLAQQSDQLALQAEAAQKEVFEATFFRLLDSIRRLVEGFEISPTSRGIDAMFDWAIELRDQPGHRLRSAQCVPDEAAKMFAAWLSGHRRRLAPYLALVLMTLEFVEKSKRPDAIFYIDILRATLSPGELFLLFHHGVGEGGTVRFKALAEKWGLLETFDPTDFDLPGDRRLWYSARRIPRDYGF